MIAVTSEQMSLIDSKAQSDYCCPAILLMENAGINCYSILERDVFPLYGHDSTVFICGRGNNGGDALVMARCHFLAGHSGTVIMTGRQGKEGPASVNHDICIKLGIPVINYMLEPEKASAVIKKSRIIVDGISGTGISGSLKDMEAAVCALVNSCDSFVCSIDVPSGIGDSYCSSFPCIEADLTITIGLPKKALYHPGARQKCGRIVLAGAAFPPQLLESAPGGFVVEDDSAAGRLLRYPAAWSHKNRRGHCAIFAGSKGKSGAALLSSKAALKSLAGLVTLYTDPDICAELHGSFPPLMINPLNSEKTEEYMSGFSSYIAGPGWGFEKPKQLLLEKLIASHIPLVIDADAITHLKTVLSDSGHLITSAGNCIITPHPGEFSALTGADTAALLDNPEPYLRDFTAKTGITAVLKSHVTWICFPDSGIAVVDGMNPALATAGSGDILAGIIGGLLACGHKTGDAALCGVLIHRMAGINCFRDRGYFSSDELLDYISPAIKAYRKA